MTSHFQLLRQMKMLTLKEKGGAKELSSWEKKISFALKCHLQLFITPGPKMCRSLKTEGGHKEDLM